MENIRFLQLFNGNLKFQLNVIEGLRSREFELIWINVSANDKLEKSNNINLLEIHLKEQEYCYANTY